ncbi:MAG TPA: hypothetical protein VGM17_08730 [Rhizomicrobium sp.]|jgi:hypothetical protein
MSDSTPAQWAHVFAGKTERELHEIATPLDLPQEQAMAFRLARRAAIVEAGKAEHPAHARVEPLAETAIAAAPERAATETADENIPQKNEAAASDHAAALEQLTQASVTSHSRPWKEAIPFVIPQGPSEEMLERQLASCAGLIDHLAQYIGRYDSDVQACLNFADRIASLMKSSAGVAKVVGRLRGLAPDETRHRVLVEYAPPGGGVLQG